MSCQETSFVAKTWVSKLDTVARLRYRECVNQLRSLIQQQLMQTEEQLVKSNNIGLFYEFVNKRISSRSGIPPDFSGAYPYLQMAQLSHGQLFWGETKKTLE